MTVTQLYHTPIKHFSFKVLYQLTEKKKKGRGEGEDVFFDLWEITSEVKRSFWRPAGKLQGRQLETTTN